MKTKAFLLLLVSCTTLQVNADDTDENSVRPLQLHVFPKQSELVYGWRADVSTGARVPETDENHASHFAITANLRVRSDATSQRVEFKLEDMQYSSYNGKVTKDKLPVIKTSLLKKCKTCGKPFIAHYDGAPGQIESVEVSNEDEVYARNMKRAIMAQFQLDFQKIPLKRAFNNVELGVTGLCSMDQNLKDVSGNGTLFTLSKFIGRCLEPIAREDYLSFRSYQPDPRNPVILTTERNYDIVKKSEDILMIREVESKSEINMQPHGLKSELHFHFTNQKLHLISDGEASTEDWEIGETLKSTLQFEVPKENTQLGTHPDLTFGAMKHDSKNAVNKTLAIMRKLAAKFHSRGTDKSQTEELHALSMMTQMISHTLKRMSSESLEKLTQRVLLTRDGTLRAILLEILPRIGTLAATRTIVAIYKTNTDFTSKEKNDMLMVVPFYLRHRSEQLVKDCESLLNSSDSDTTILAFSSIVGEVCQPKGVCSQNLVEGYIKMFFTKIEASTTYGEKLLYLQALNNIPFYVVGKTIATIISDRVKYDHNMRYAAIWASRYAQMRNSDQLYEIYWPILADCTEHPELRQSALVTLLMSRLTPNRFINLFWFVNSERNKGLYDLFYTTVQSLLNSNDPFLTDSRMEHTKAAKSVARLMPKRNISKYSPTNTILDYFDKNTGMGYKYQELSIEDISGNPTLKHYDVKRYLNGQISTDVTLLTRGFSEIDLSFFLGHFNILWELRDGKKLELPVSKVFQSLGVIPREQFYETYEIILRIRDRTVVCRYYKQITDKEIMEIFEMLGLKDLLIKMSTVRENSPVAMSFNSMLFDLSTEQEAVVSNDIGLPVTYYTQHPDILALVGDISLNNEGRKTFIKSNVALRAISQRARGMYTLNPVIGQWHGVARSKVGDIFLPLGHEIEIDTSNRSTMHVTFKWQKDKDLFNSVVHVHTTTYVFGDDHALIELKLSCPKCSNIHAVSNAVPQEINQTKHEFLDSEFEFTKDVYDCENVQESENREIFGNDIISAQSKNVRKSPLLTRFFMGLQQLNDINEQLPHSGSCGEFNRIAPKGEARQLLFEWSKEKLDRHLVGEAIFKGENGETIKTWTMKMESTFNSSETEQIASTLQIRRKLQETHYYNMVCFKLDAESPKQIDENDVWDVLYEPPWRPYVVRLGVTIGDSEDGNCPAKSGGKLLLTASSTPRKPHTVKDGDLCERDENQIFPATVECANAIRYALKARNISIDFQHNNMSENVNGIAAQLCAKLHSFLPNINTGEISNANPDGNSAIWVDGVKKELPIPNLEIPDLFKWRTTIISKHDEKRSCVAAGGHVLTYDESSIKFTAGTQWTLLSAHCGNAPMFAVFVRHIDGSDTPDTRVYLAGDVYDVSRKNNKTFSVLVNGDPFDPQLKDCKEKVDLHDDAVRIYDGRYSLWVKISNKAVTVTTGSVLAGLTCGLCGDYNHQSEIEYGFPGPDGKPVALEDLARVYSTDIDMNVTRRVRPCFWEQN